MSTGRMERMFDFSSRMMAATMKLLDWIWPRVDQRVQKFGVQPDMVVVDYGCGPGRYTRRFSRLVGPAGKVYAVDLQALALEVVKKDMARYSFEVIQQLRFLVKAQRRDRFQFHDDLVKYDQAGNVSMAQSLALVGELQGDLLLEGDLAHAQFHDEGILVHSFQETIAQLIVHFHGCPDDLIDFVFIDQLRPDDLRYVEPRITQIFTTWFY
jgi:SAM-dependent methyltransferase